jgi:CheY-like chemotaxis protein
LRPIEPEVDDRMDHEHARGRPGRTAGRPDDEPGQVARPRRDRPAVVGAARILVVEDQGDVRQMLATALELEGHRVDQAANATEGLRRLEEARYNLVLSDYAMPDRTGTWMLTEAGRRGLLSHTPALIITAHPDVGGFGDVHVIAKPLDLDRFLELVGRMLDECETEADRDGSGASGGGSSARIELVLYTSPWSPASVQAKKNLERLLPQLDTSMVELSICDLGSQPEAGERDGVAFTPTLVRRYPEPRMWVLGNLREVEMVKDFLRACGVVVRS